MRFKSIIPQWNNKGREVSDSEYGSIGTYLKIHANGYAYAYKTLEDYKSLNGQAASSMIVLKTDLMGDEFLVQGYQEYNINGEYERHYQAWVCKEGDALIPIKINTSYR